MGRTGPSPDSRHRPDLTLDRPPAVPAGASLSPLPTPRQARALFGAFRSPERPSRVSYPLAAAPVHGFYNDTVGAGCAICGADDHAPEECHASR